MDREEHEDGLAGRSFGDAANELIQEVQEGARDPGDAPLNEERSPFMVPGILAVVFAGVVVWNLTLLSRGAEPLVGPEARRADGVMVFVATQAVQDFTNQNGRRPVTLAEAGIDAPGLVYSFGSDGFAITSEGSAGPVKFDATERMDDFLLRLGIAPPEALPDEVGR